MSVDGGFDESRGESDRDIVDPIKIGNLEGIGQKIKDGYNGSILWEEGHKRPRQDELPVTLSIQPRTDKQVKNDEFDVSGEVHLRGWGYDYGDLSLDSQKAMLREVAMSIHKGKEDEILEIGSYYRVIGPNGEDLLIGRKKTGDSRGEFAITINTGFIEDRNNEKMPFQGSPKVENAISVVATVVDGLDRIREFAAKNGERPRNIKYIVGLPENN